MVYALTYKITHEFEKDRANNLRPKEVAERNTLTCIRYIYVLPKSGVART